MRMNLVVLVQILVMMNNFHSMKRNIILLIIFSLFSANTYSQNWISSQVIKGWVVEPKYSCIDDQDNFYLLGVFDTINFPFSEKTYGSNDLLLVKYYSSGNLAWIKHIGSALNDACGGIATDNNNIYVLGNYQGSCIFKGEDTIASRGSYDVFLAKYNTDGDFQWTKRICSGTNFQGAIDLRYNNFDDHLVISGFFKDSLIIGATQSQYDTLLGPSTISSSFISLHDLEGEVIVAKRFLQDYDLTRIIKIGFGSDGYYFSGNFRQSLNLDGLVINSYSANYNDAFLFKTDLNLNSIWVRTIKGTRADIATSLTTDEYDNVYLLGNYQSPQLYIDSTENKIITRNGSMGGADTYICKYNRSGILQWLIQRGNTGSDYYYDFVLRNKVIFATGYFANQIIFNNDTLHTSSINNQDIFLAAFNEIGDPISAINILGTGDYGDAGNTVKMDASSRAYVSGFFRSPQIQIGDQTYTSNNINKSDLFFAIYQQPFKAVITDEEMISCNGLSDGMLTVTPYFGRPPYTYSWSHSPSLNNPVAENLAAGEYTVTITDANDSTASITAEVYQAPSINIAGVLTPVSCNNGQDGGINITVTGGNGNYQYFWTSLDGSGIEPIQEDQSNLSAGTYTIAVKDKNNCADTVDFIVLEPAKFSYEGTVITNVTTPPGNNGAINLNPAGGNYPYTFVWTGPSGYSNFSEDIGALANGGLYNLRITDAKNCISDTAFLVNDATTMIAQVVAKTNVLCHGGNTGTATVRVTNGVPPFSYDWGALGTITDSTQVGMTAGDYIVTVTDDEGTIASASVSIIGPAAPLNLILNPEDLRCNGDNSGVLDLNVTGGTVPYTFSWSNGYTGEDLVNVPADQYTVTVTDANGCSAIANDEIEQPQAIGLIVNLLTALQCSGDRTAVAVANATGGNPPGVFEYLWDDPGTQTTQTAFDLGAGTYNVTVTDMNNCSRSGSIVILEPEAMTMTIQETAPSCPGTSDGILAPTVMGGTGSYDYIWSNNRYTRFNTDIPAGTYALLVNDQNNCTLSDTIVLEDPDTVKITSVNITDVSCLGKTDGAFAILATGGSGNLEYSVNNGTTFTADANPASLPAGDYTVLVRDENNCESESYPATITILDTVVIDEVIAADATCLGIDDGSLQITAHGGSGALEYSIDGGTTFGDESTITSLLAGDYTIVVRDENECTSEEINQPLAYTDTIRLVSVEGTDLSCSGLPDGSIAIQAQGGTGTYQYSVDGGTSFGTTSTVNNLQQGSYTVVVKDENECLSDEDNVTLDVTEICDMIIYDAFSPNDDGKNEVWNIGNVQNYPDIKVTIFNLWGKAVFSSTGYDTPWDGTWEGKDLPAGTYYYVIDPGDGSDVITGDVSIVR